MKALIISYSFPPATGGAPTLMHDLCKHVPKTSFSVITTNSNLAVSWGDYDSEYILDCDIVRLPVKTYNMRDGFRFFLLVVLRELFVSEKEFDVLLAVYPYEFDLFAAYVLHCLTRKPFAVYMHDLFSEVKRTAHLYQLWKSVERRIFSAASVVIVTNEKFKDYYTKKGVKRVVVLPSCVDLDQDLRQEMSYNKKHHSEILKIVYTGSVYTANEDAILCFLEAAKNVSNIEVKFASPSKKDYLKDVCVGFLSKKECYRLQRSADVLFLPLSFKNPYPDEITYAFPRKALEYLAAGKPILSVVPKGSFMQEFIEKYNVGIVVTELSVGKLAEAIEELKDEEKRRIFIKNALETVSLFDAKKQSRHLMSILESILSSSK